MQWGTSEQGNCHPIWHLKGKKETRLVPAEMSGVGTRQEGKRGDPVWLGGLSAQESSKRGRSTDSGLLEVKSAGLTCGQIKENRRHVSACAHACVQVCARTCVCALKEMWFLQRNNNLSS